MDEEQLHEVLTDLGFEGSCDRVAALTTKWEEGQTKWVDRVSFKRKPTANGI